MNRTTGWVVTWYIYDGDTMIAEKSETGYTEYEIPGVGWVSPGGAGYTTTYTLTNQRGDTVGLAVGNQLTNIRDYDAYGGFYTLLASSDSDHRYVGGKGVIWNTASQTYTMGLREYSPYLGRFLNQDPIGYSGGLNLYAYCGNEPVMRTDPSGTHTELNYWQQVGGVFRGYGQALNLWGNLNQTAALLGDFAGHDWELGYMGSVGSSIWGHFVGGLVGDDGPEAFGNSFGTVLMVAAPGMKRIPGIGFGEIPNTMKFAIGDYSLESRVLPKGGATVLRVDRAGEQLGRFDVGPLPPRSTIPKSLHGKTRPHFHIRGKGGMKRHRPYERPKSK